MKLNPAAGSRSACCAAGAAPLPRRAGRHDAAAGVAWEIWLTPQQTIKVEITAQHSPLQPELCRCGSKGRCATACATSAVARRASTPPWPDVRVFAPDAREVTVYIDTSGEPLFKRGWREDKGDAPLKETLAAAMIAATGWTGQPDA